MKITLLFISPKQFWFRGLSLFRYKFIAAFMKVKKNFSIISGCMNKKRVLDLALFLSEIVRLFGIISKKSFAEIIPEKKLSVTN
jgi:hypothetical protein